MLLPIITAFSLWLFQPVEASELTAQAQCSLILKRLGDITGYRPGIQIKAEYVERQHLPKILQQTLEREYSDEEIADQEAATIRFGLVPPDFRLKETFLSLLSEQAGGVYLPDERKLYVLRDAPMGEVILSTN